MKSVISSQFLSFSFPFPSRRRTSCCHRYFPPDDNFFLLASNKTSLFFYFKYMIYISIKNKCNSRLIVASIIFFGNVCYQTTMLVAFEPDCKQMVIVFVCLPPQKSTIRMVNTVKLPLHYSTTIYSFKSNGTTTFYLMLVHMGTQLTFLR